MKIGAAFSLLSIVTGLVLTACSSSSERKGTGGADGGGAGGSGNSGASGGAGGTAGVGSSGGTGGLGGSGSPNANCAAVCDAIAEANCPGGQPRAQCLTDCAATTNECPAQAEAFATCVSTMGTVACGDSGDPTLSGCDDSLIRVSGCSACLADSLDDGCDACQKANCCSQLKAFAGAAEIFDFSDCLAACTTQACITSCESSFPNVRSAFDAISRCTETSCLTPCSAL